jgi:hypothetical protein
VGGVSLVVAGVAAAAAVGVASNWLAGAVVGLVYGAIACVVSLVPVWVEPEIPSALPPVPLRRRLRAAADKENLMIGLGFGAGTALIAVLILGVVPGLAVGLACGVVMGVWGMAYDATIGAASLVRADPGSGHLGGRPDAVLRASRRAGITSMIGTIPYGAVSLSLFGLVAGLVAGPVAGVATFLVLAAVLGWVIGLANGLDAWLYHYWLRLRLARMGLLPARLPGFLEWCAAPERGWIRITDAYEFRHRELLEHLAD